MSSAQEMNINPRASQQLLGSYSCSQVNLPLCFSEIVSVWHQLRASSVYGPPCCIRISGPHNHTIHGEVWKERERERRYECGPSINLHLSLSVFTYPVSFPLLLMVYFNWFTKTRSMSMFSFESLRLSVLWSQAWFTWDCSQRLPLHQGEFSHDIHVRLFPFGSIHLYCRFLG